VKDAIGAELYEGDHVAHASVCSSQICLTPRIVVHLLDDYVLLDGARPGKVKPKNLVKLWEQPL